jgi:hypothetical protein
MGGGKDKKVCGFVHVSGRQRRFLAAIGGGLLFLVPCSLPRALEVGKGEAPAILDCERRLCYMLQQKDAKGEDLKCDLTKTWARTVIKGAEQPTLKWGFGDARCSVRIQIPRALVHAALTARGTDYKLWLPAHTASCIVEEEGGTQTVKATLAPKLVFRDGKVSKIWVNLIDVEGPVAIKGTLWAAAKLADDVGLFHWQMLKSFNKFIYTTCPRKHPLAASLIKPAASKSGAVKPPAADPPGPAAKGAGG